MREPTHREMEALKVKAIDLVRSGMTPEAASNTVMNAWEWEQSKKNAPSGGLRVGLGELLQAKAAKRR